MSYIIHIMGWTGLAFSAINWRNIKWLDAIDMEKPLYDSGIKNTQTGCCSPTCSGSLLSLFLGQAPSSDLQSSGWSVTLAPCLSTLSNHPLPMDWLHSPFVLSPLILVILYLNTFINLIMPMSGSSSLVWPSCNTGRCLLGHKDSS